jgi:GNAT superfamily N-acetyltransferase
VTQCESLTAESTPNPVNNMKLSWREASESDIGLLADWNRQLIQDERHRNDMTVDQLAERMRNWLKKGEYRAILFSSDEPVCHAVFRREPDLIHLRQFFVRRDRRRTGIGRAAVSILREQIWPRDVRLTVDVLCHNPGGVEFWRSVGYRDWNLTLEVMPR